MKRGADRVIPIIAAVFGLGWLLVGYLQRRGLYLHIGWLNSYRAVWGLGLACLAVLFLWAVRGLSRRGGSTLLVIGFSLAGLLGGGVLLFMAAMGETESTYFNFSAPDGAHTVVVEEKSWLLGGWGYFYEPVCPGLLRKLDAEYDTDDGYRPFSAGAYRLTWGEDSLLVEYDFGSGGRWTSCTVRYSQRRGDILAQGCGGAEAVKGGTDDGAEEYRALGAEHLVQTGADGLVFAADPVPDAAGLSK